MAEGEKSQSWWHTFPGVLTAIAGVLTALTGLVAALSQMGLVGGASKATPSAYADTTKGSTPAARASGPASVGPPASSVASGEASTDIDKPTPLSANQIAGRGVGQDISYYYTLEAGPGTVKVTIDGKNKHSGVANAIGLEISDLDANRLLDIHTGNTTDDKRVIDTFELGRRQRIIVRVKLDEVTIDYKFRLEGAVHLQQ